MIRWSEQDNLYDIGSEPVLEKATDKIYERCRKFRKTWLRPTINYDRLTSSGMNNKLEKPYNNYSNYMEDTHIQEKRHHNISNSDPLRYNYLKKIYTGTDTIKQPLRETRYIQMIKDLEENLIGSQAQNYYSGKFVRPTNRAIIQTAAQTRYYPAMVQQEEKLQIQIQKAYSKQAEELEKELHTQRQMCLKGF